VRPVDDAVDTPIRKLHNDFWRLSSKTKLSATIVMPRFRSMETFGSSFSVWAMSR